MARSSPSSSTSPLKHAERRAREQPQHREHGEGLARAALSDDPDLLSRVDIEIDAAHDLLGVAFRRMPMCRSRRESSELTTWSELQRRVRRRLARREAHHGLTAREDGAEHALVARAGRRGHRARKSVHAQESDEREQARLLRVLGNTEVVDQARSRRRAAGGAAPPSRRGCVFPRRRRRAR